jgi:hypothetical protein
MSGRLITPWVIFLNPSHSRNSMEYPRVISSWRNSDAALHKTLVTDEVCDMRDLQCVIARSPWHEEPYPAAATSDVNSAAYFARDDHEAPQRLDQCTQTLIRVSGVPGEMSVCF